MLVNPDLGLTECGLGLTCFIVTNICVFFNRAPAPSTAHSVSACNTLFTTKMWSKLSRSDAAARNYLKIEDSLFVFPFQCCGCPLNSLITFVPFFFLISFVAANEHNKRMRLGSSGDQLFSEASSGIVGLDVSFLVLFACCLVAVIRWQAMPAETAESMQRLVSGSVARKRSEFEQ